MAPESTSNERMVVFVAASEDSLMAAVVKGQGSPFQRLYTPLPQSPACSARYLEHPHAFCASKLPLGKSGGSVSVYIHSADRAIPRSKQP